MRIEKTEPEMAAKSPVTQLSQISSQSTVVVKPPILQNIPQMELPQWGQRCKTPLSRGVSLVLNSSVHSQQYEST